MKFNVFLIILCILLILLVLMYRINFYKYTEHFAGDDKTDYILKTEIPSCPHIHSDNYILKTEIPPCPKIDKNLYILKTQIPVSPVCPNLDDYVLKRDIPPVKVCPTIDTSKIYSKIEVDMLLKAQLDKYKLQNVNSTCSCSSYGDFGSAK